MTLTQTTIPETSRTVSPARWARAALGAFGLAVVLTLGMHVFLGAGVDPVGQVISDYAISGGAVAFAGSALALVAGTGFLLVALSRAGIALGRLFPVLLLGWCAGLTVCAFVRTDPTGAPRTVPGAIHYTAGIALFLCLPPALAVLAKNVAPQQPLLAARLRRLLRWAVGALAVFAFTQLLVSSTGSAWLPQGLAERVVFGLYLAALALPALSLLGTERKSW